MPLTVAQKQALLAGLATITIRQQNLLTMANCIGASLTFLQVYYLTKQNKKKAARVWWQKHRSSHWRRVILPNSNYFDEAEFRTAFRMNRSSAMTLLRLLGPSITGQDTQMRKAVPAQDRLLMFLYYAAQGGSLKSTSNQFGYGKSTLSDHVEIVAWAILNVMYDNYIHWPSPMLMVATAAANEESHGVPQCCGSIDGSHIAIERPVDFGDDYFNRKSYYSIVLQAVVDDRRRFMDIVLGWPGRVADGRVFRGSSLGANIEEYLGQCMDREVTIGFTGANGEEVKTSIPMYILGDSAYANTKRMVTTYETTEIHRDGVVKELNNRLAGIRYVVEGTFGILKSRFRILLSPLASGKTSLRRTCNLVMALCVLHNFLIDERDSYDVNTPEVQMLLSEYRTKYPPPPPMPEDEGTEVNGEQVHILPEETTRAKLYTYIQHRRNLRTLRDEMD